MICSFVYFTLRNNSAKFRRLYAVGGCMVFMWLSTHGFLFYRRQREHCYLTKKIPSISWEDFILSIIFEFNHTSLKPYQFPHYTYFATGKVPRVPDVRFSFNALLDLQKASTDSSNPLEAVEFVIDEFPSNWYFFGLKYL
uniref:Cytochrome c oxidase assembly protein COX11 n=1 Tax=Angiostrongylus cantonensis TaxID=6313 RepID=A0A0K0DAP2_ANGCA